MSEIMVSNNNGNNSQVVRTALIDGAALASFKAAEGLYANHKINEGLKFLSKDTFSAKMAEKIATDYVSNKDLYVIQGLKGMAVSIEKDADVTKDALVDALKTAKKDLPKHLMKSAAIFGAVGLGIGAFLGLINKSRQNTLDKNMQVALKQAEIKGELNAMKKNDIDQ